MVFWTGGAQKPAAPRALEEYSSGLGAGAAFEDAWVNNPAMGLHDAMQLDIAEHGAPTTAFRAPGPRQAPDSEIMSADEANHWFGIPGELNFDSRIPARAAHLRYDWKRDEIRRRDVLNRASQTTLAAAARLGASFVAQAVDPLNIAASFIPVVGEARYARLLAAAGESAFARAGVRAGVGALEGAAGAAVVEPLVYAGAKARGQDYDLWDSLANVGYGAALGGGLHTIGGAAADAVRSYVERRRKGALTGGEALVEEIGRPMHEALTRGAIAQVTEGRQVTVAEGLDVADPGAKVPEYRADPGDVGGSIERFVDRVSGKQDHGYLRIGEVAPSTVTAARQAGLEIEGFNHVMQGDDVRHALATHGRDVPPDEVPLTAADFARVPDIIANPDSVRPVMTNRNLPGLQFSKRAGDITFVVEEVRAGKKRLAFKSMWIKRAGGSDRYGPDGSPLEGSGGLDRSDGSLDPASPQTARPERGPSSAGQSVGDAVREINAPDQAEAQAIERIYAETAKSLNAPDDLQTEIAAQQELLAEETALLGEDLDARDRATLEEGKAIDQQAAEEGKAYEAASACMVRNGS